MSNEKNKLAILGASRGLGRALVDLLISEKVPEELLLFSRKKALLEDAAENAKSSGVAARFFGCDFSNSNDQSRCFETLSEHKPQKIIYIAGGGPFGTFGDKAWKDHDWAFQVSLMFPAKVVHWAANNDTEQVIVIGSAIAEDKGDPLASSYASAKHALLGLHRSVTGENPSLDFRLYSPSYMDTDLLPPNARPRQEGRVIHSPQDVAKDLWSWAKSDDRCGHRLFN